MIYYCYACSFTGMYAREVRDHVSEPELRCWRLFKWMERYHFTDMSIVNMWDIFGLLVRGT